MKQPSDRDIKALRRKYNELIAQAQAKCINDFQAVRDYVFNELANLKENDSLYQALEKYIINCYNMTWLKDMLQAGGKLPQKEIFIKAGYTEQKAEELVQEAENESYEMLEDDNTII